MNKQFVGDFKPVIVELNENYRSSKKVLEAAEKIIPDAEYIVGTVKEGFFEINGLKDEEAEAQWVVGKIKELIALKTHGDIEGEITCEKIAVLARNKYIFNSIEIQLKTTENMNLGDVISQVSDELNKELIALVTKLGEDGSNIIMMLEDFRDNLNVEDENEKNMIFNDIEELLKHWRNYAKNTDNKSLHQFKNAMALGQTHPLTQHSGITLSTVHTMKGQEFDIVFVIGMDDETFPDYRAVRNRGVEMTQEKNNLYVAFTRAKRFLYVTWPQKRMMPWKDYKFRKISRFLKVFND